MPAASRSTPHFYSEAEDYWHDDAKPDGPFVIRETHNPEAFIAHRDAVVELGMCVPALTAAFVLTKRSKLCAAGCCSIWVWFVNEATQMTPQHSSTARPVRPAKARAAGRSVVEAVHLAEVVQSIPFLSTSEAFPATDQAAKVQKWFAEYFRWMNSSRLAGLARDTGDLPGASWLLQSDSDCSSHEIPKDDAPNYCTLRHQYKVEYDTGADSVRITFFPA